MEWSRIPTELGAAEMLTTHELGGWYSSLGSSRLKGLQTSPIDSWSTTDQDDVRRIALRSRPAHYLAKLGTLSLDWYEGSLPIAEVGTIRVIDIPEFTNLAPSRRVGELAARLDAGGTTGDDKFSAKYRRMRPGFDIATMKGRPMLVSTFEESPHVEFEGLTRLCCIASKLGHDEALPSEVPVLLGVGERVIEWQPFYGRP